MRKLLFVLPLLYACEKDKCYNCEIQTWSDINRTNVVTRNVKKCGKIDEINDYQDANTFESYDQNNNFVLGSWCNCD